MTIENFETWRPLIAAVDLSDRTGFSGHVEVAGGHGLRGAMLPEPPPLEPGRARQVEDYREAWAPIEVVREALKADGHRGIEFDVEITAATEVTVRIVVLNAPSYRSDKLTIVDGSLPEPYRRRAVPPRPDHPLGWNNLDALERTLREIWPDEVGMSDVELDAYETRLGRPLPPEARVLYSVIRDHQVDYSMIPPEDPIGFDIWPLDSDRRQTHRTQDGEWWFLARTAAHSDPDSPVQALSQPPEWFVIGGDVATYAIDMVPGATGKVGQVIMWNDEDRWDQPFGAEVVADSLLDFLQSRYARSRRGATWTEDLPKYGEVTTANGRLIEEVVSDELEVLRVVRGQNPISLRAVAGLPRLRTVEATAGSITDVLALSTLDNIEYLEIGVDEWNTLLDAGPVPRQLKACGVDRGLDHRYTAHQVAEVLDRIRSFFGLPDKGQTLTVRGRLS